MRRRPGVGRPVDRRAVSGQGVPLQALKNGGVLGIRRQQPTAAALQFGQNHRSSGDQRLLVGQGQILAGPDGGQGGQQAGATDDAGDDQLGAGPGGHLTNSLPAPQQLGQARRPLAGLQGRQPLLQLPESARIGQGNGLRGVALDLLDQQCQVVAGAQGHHPEAIRKLSDDFQGLGADGAGGAQHGNGFQSEDPGGRRRSSLSPALDRHGWADGGLN